MFILYLLIFLENPCPHLGNIVTIKLSEDEEVVTATDGVTTTRVVETHFQMNYAAGEWKRIKKMRKTEETPASVSTVMATATG
jgi:negative elongation factor A